MINVSYERSETGEQIDKLIDTGTAPNDPARVHPYKAYRHLTVSTEVGEVANDGNDSETVTVEVVSGLQVARGETPANVLSHDGDVRLRVDDVETTKALTDGSVSFDLTTDKPASSTIEIEAVGLADHPAESDSATIEVTQA